ncbi:outer membrane protein assembly factor BamB family protein [Haloarchaeobius iranensis]|uniref:Outer membrane protein assembly factor BamB, contains PQQ-like beta-propeller repeat n=1 Tax=Haloarchaeobius iranensis TaxID=996166 RepID=A0A1G9ZZ97_9EURY|nr:PQQ-binding-like beta-propeller repeat protein [Haloarchaeobius iranensis]SDN26588.1 Outer membrane protein assembly factor BamB, contains PQQ-like beta-propeller repeat [Haloarchaeobius iranensis]
MDGTGRREFLATSVGATVLSAGCLGDESADEPAAGPNESSGPTSTEANTGDGSDSGSSVTGEWPMYGHDSGRTSANTDVTGPTTSPTRAWAKQDLTLGSGCRVVKDGSLFAKHDGVHRFDMVSGEEEWSFEPNGTLPDEIIATASTIVGYGDPAFAVDIETGERLWLENDPTEAFRAWHPVVDGDELVSVTEREVLRGDTRTGTVAGRTELSEPLTVTNDVVGTPESLFVSFDSSTTRLARVDAASGTVEWRTSDVGASPVYNGDAVFTTEREGTSSDRSFVYAHDPETAERRWRATVPETVLPSGSPLTVTDDTLYVGTRNQQLVALDTATGERRWTNDLFSKPDPGHVATDAGVFVCTRGGALLVVSADGERRWDREGAAASKPIVTEDRLLHFGRQGVVCLSTDDATE